MDYDKWAELSKNVNYVCGVIAILSLYMTHTESNEAIYNISQLMPSLEENLTYIRENIEDITIK